MRTGTSALPAVEALRHRVDPDDPAPDKGIRPGFEPLGMAPGGLLSGGSLFEQQRSPHGLLNFPRVKGRSQVHRSSARVDRIDFSLGLRILQSHRRPDWRSILQTQAGDLEFDPIQRGHDADWAGQHTMDVALLSWSVGSD